MSDRTEWMDGGVRVKSSRGFTLVEIMVVVGIIGLLIGLLVPALTSVKASARATASLSNLRQWGMGTVMFCNQNKETLPWEGFKDAAQMPLNLAEKTWWGNAIPPFVGQTTYKQMSDAATPDDPVPMPPDATSIFIDPAQVPLNAPYYGGGKQFFFCYVPNSQLNNTWETQSAATNPYARMKLSFVQDASRTILMLEMRTIKTELSSDDVYYSKDLAQHRADWKRYAARHFKGGHMLFVDGHAKHVLNDKATTNKQGTRNPNEAGGDWNTNDLIWDPSGPATDE